MIITLQDKSQVNLLAPTLRFRVHDPAGLEERPDKTAPDYLAVDVNFYMLARLMADPPLKFGECFRRVYDLPRYSPIGSKHDFNVYFLTTLYKFPGTWYVGMFSSSHTEYRFLDGGIIMHSGYGWGSHSWTVVEGAEALRVVCLFFGIQQPRFIKGEGERRPLAILLEELSSVPLQNNRRSTFFNPPEPLKRYFNVPI